MPKAPHYTPLGNGDEDTTHANSLIEPNEDLRGGLRTCTTSLTSCIVIGFVFTAVMGFAAGIFAAQSPLGDTGEKNPSHGTMTPRIPLPDVRREFRYDSPFSKEPPQGPKAGSESEPIWDSLIPSKSIND